MRTYLLCLPLLLIALFLPGCSAAPLPAVSAEEAQALWERQEALIFDVRTPAEYRSGHIPGVPLIPLQELSTRYAEIPRDQTVLIICRSGNRSAKAVEMLRSKGYDKVKNVTGGMQAWQGPVTTD